MCSHHCTKICSGDLTDSYLLKKKTTVSLKQDQIPCHIIWEKNVTFARLFILAVIASVCKSKCKGGSGHVSRYSWHVNNVPSAAWFHLHWDPNNTGTCSVLLIMKPIEMRHIMPSIPALDKAVSLLLYGPVSPAGRCIALPSIVTGIYTLNNN